MTVSPLLTCAAPAARSAVRETSAGKRPRVEQAQRAREKGKCQLHMLIHAHSTHTLTRTLILPHARTRSARTLHRAELGTQPFEREEGRERRGGCAIGLGAHGSA